MRDLASWLAAAPCLACHGLACHGLACHGLAGHGLAWRASFGPDLSEVVCAYDPETIAGFLQDVPFPSMAPGEHQLLLRSGSTRGAGRRCPAEGSGELLPEA